MNDLTEEEAQQYDRQIRLWGADAQKSLKMANVIIIGVNGVSCEVIKNLVLAGINTLALCDENNVTVDDINSNYLISRSAINENRAKSIFVMTKNLNPRVNIETYDHMPLELSKSVDTTLSIKNFDIIICCESKLKHYKSESLWADVNQCCRKHGKLFFAMDSFGWYGITFIDLGCHYYSKNEQVNQKEGDKPSTSETKVVKQSKEFCSFSDVLSIEWSKDELKSKLKRMPNIQFLLIVLQSFVSQFGRYPVKDDMCVLIEMWHHYADRHGLSRDVVSDDSFVDCIGAGQQPVNAVLGGLVTQEIIKAISHQNEPFGNFVLFNGLTCAGDATFIKP